MSDIATLTWWSSFWDATSVVAAVFVLIGVVGESVADFDMLAVWTGLEPRPQLRKQVEKSGLLILIVALAVEVIAAMGSHNASGQIVAILNAKTGQALVRAANLGVTVDNLHDFVVGKETEAEKQLAEFKGFATKQQKQLDDTILELKNDGIRLNKARDDALAAADASKDAVAKMNAALNEEKAVRDKMLAAIAPRTLGEQRQKDVSDAVRAYAPQRYFAAISQGADDGVAFWASLYAALEKAGWVYIPPNENAIRVGTPPANTPISAIPGVEILFSASRETALSPAAVALGSALHADGMIVAVNRDPNFHNENGDDIIFIRIGVRSPRE